MKLLNFLNFLLFASTYKGISIDTQRLILSVKQNISAMITYLEAYFIYIYVFISYFKFLEGKFVDKSFI